MAVERVVVEVHLRVEREQIAVLGDDERVDFDQRRVGRLERVVDGVHQLAGLRDLRPVEAEREGELARLERRSARRRGG